MNFCLLCLERTNDTLDIIETNSLQWKILDISNKLEKYFWPLNTMQPKSGICLQCWQKIEDFHNFYEYIEKAHMNLEEIKIESQTDLSIDSMEEELTTNECELENFNPCMGAEIVLIETLQNENNPTGMLATNEKVLGTEEDNFVEEINIEEYIKQEDSSNNDEELEEEKIDLENNYDNYIEINNENIEETNRLNETQLPELKTNKLQIQKVIEFSSDNNDSSSDEEDGTKPKPKQQKRNRIPNRCFKEMDEFIAKEYGQINCDLCEVPLKDFYETFKHYRQVHNRKGYIKCCKKIFQSRSFLVDHLNLHLNPDYFKCTECGAVLTSRNNLKIHKLRAHKPADVEFEHKCEDCGKTFPMNFMLRKHKLAHIGVVGEFPCKECGKIYRAEHLLKSHFDVVHLKKRVKICAVCGKVMDTSNELKAHMTQHEPQTPVHCDVCGIRLTNRRNYLIHRRVQHPEGGKQEHHCHLCNKISPSHRALLRHINMSHKKGYDHKCTICGKAFKMVLGLKEHMATHTGDVLYRCKYCPKTFNSQANFFKHRKNIHPKEYAEYKYQKLYGTDNVPKQNDV